MRSRARCYSAGFKNILPCPCHALSTADGGCFSHMPPTCIAMNNRTFLSIMVWQPCVSKNLLCEPSGMETVRVDRKRYPLPHDAPVPRTFAMWTLMHSFGVQLHLIADWQGSGSKFPCPTSARAAANSAHELRCPPGSNALIYNFGNPQGVFRRFKSIIRVA